MTVGKARGAEQEVRCRRRRRRLQQHLVLAGPAQASAGEGRRGACPTAGRKPSAVAWPAAQASSFRRAPSAPTVPAWTALVVAAVRKNPPLHTMGEEEEKIGAMVAQGRRTGRGGEGQEG